MTHVEAAKGLGVGRRVPVPVLAMWAPPSKGRAAECEVAQNIVGKYLTLGCVFVFLIVGRSGWGGCFAAEAVAAPRLFQFEKISNAIHLAGCTALRPHTLGLWVCPVWAALYTVCTGTCPL